MPQRKQRGKKRASGTRPVKPYPEFPLTAHPTGLWCKAINGKTWYFGPWARRQNGKLVRLPDDGWQDALNRYIDQREDLYAGRAPGIVTSEITVGDLCEQFLSAKLNLLNNGEIVPRTFSDCCFRQWPICCITCCGNSVWSALKWKMLRPARFARSC